MKVTIQSQAPTRINYVIKTHKKGLSYTNPHLHILNKGLNSGKPSRDEIANSFVLLFENEQDCETIYWITFSLWQSKYWHSSIIGSVIPFLRLSDFINEFARKADEMLNDFEQHQKDVQALRLLLLKEKQFQENINLINDLKRVIMHRYCK